VLQRERAKTVGEDNAEEVDRRAGGKSFVFDQRVQVAQPQAFSPR